MKAGPHYGSETLFIASLEVLLSAAPTGVKTDERAIHALNIPNNF